MNVVGGLVREYNKLDVSTNHKGSLFQQAYGPIMETYDENEHEFTDMRDDERKQPNQEDFPSQVNLLETDAECTHKKELEDMAWTISAEDTLILMGIDSNGCKKQKVTRYKYRIGINRATILYLLSLYQENQNI